MTMDKIISFCLYMMTIITEMITLLTVIESRPTKIATAKERCFRGPCSGDNDRNIGNDEDDDDDEGYVT